jgi:D-3-phosphoglycerate dehydrogenase / 2-oxoglutarate reductase
MPIPRYSLNKDHIRILLLEGIHPDTVACLNKAGYHNIRYEKTALDDEALLAAVQGVHFIGIRSRTKLSKRVIDAADKLVAIGCFCIGTNQVDLLAAAARGIPVFNAPFSNTRSVAELVLGEILLLLRDIPAKNAAAHRGQWQKSASASFEVRGKQLGIVGYGHIGSQLGILAEAIGMRVCYYDVIDQLALGNATPLPNLDAILDRSDVVALHVPETEQTRGMIGSEQLARMRAGSVLINASRGSVVDINALTESLRSGHVAGAAIDVFPVEPSGNNEEFVSPLRDFDNVILTPHVGGSTVEAQANIGTEVATKLITYSDNGSTRFAVNFPEVSLPAHAGTCRLLHIHENKPGIMQQLNQIFAAEGINIAAQYLQTTANIGYVVFDLDTDRSQEILNRISKLPGTVRARILY